MEIKGCTRFKAPIDEETFLDISSTCFDQESRSSMTSPNFEFLSLNCVQESVTNTLKHR